MSSNFMKPKQARETFPCPIARTFDKKAGPNCDADRCILWRWKARMATDPEFSSAIKREMSLLAADHKEKTGKDRPASGFHSEAVKRVMRNPEGYGVDREEGYCGLGGLPT